MSSPEEKKRESQRFITDQIDPIVNKMLIEILKDKPHNVLKYMAEWIYKEQNPDYVDKALSNAPLTYGKGIEHQKSFHASIQSETPQTLSRKTTNKHVSDDEMEMPRIVGTYKKPDVSSEDEDEQGDDVPDLNANLAAKKKDGKIDKNRSSVSAEVFGKNNSKENFKARIVPKNQEAKNKIRGKLLQSFLFKGLEEKDLNTCVDAMEIKKYAKNDTIMTQGDEGNELFIVESGTQACLKRFPKATEDKLLKEYRPGEAFGE